ncbi:MAG: chromate transporter [Proteocatella sp.]
MLTKLFLSFMKIGAISFGGGYAVISLIQQEIVGRYGIIGSGQFIDMVALSEMTPGPLAINASTFVGFHSDGIIGAIVATIGVVTVPVILALILAAYYKKNGENRLVGKILYGIRPCVVPIILVAVIKLIPMSLNDIYSIFIAITVAVIYHYKKISPILLIIIGGALGYSVYGIIIPLLS